MDHLLKDLRHAIRSMAQRPAITLLAVGSLALGIGANTTIFTLVKAILLSPLPVSDPDTLVATYTEDGKYPDRFLGTSYPNLKDLEAQSKALSGLAISTFQGVFISLGDEPLQITTEFVSGNFFDVLDVDTVLGRPLVPADAPAPGAGEAVVVLSHGFWQSRFGADPAVIGSVVRLGNRPFTVVGVAPRGFTGEQSQFEPHLWLPLTLLEQLSPFFDPAGDVFNSRRGLFFGAVGRLATGVSRQQAEAELRQVASRLEEQFPTDNKGRSVRLVPLAEAAINPSPEARAGLRQGMGLLMGLVGAVLLIACANVANLLLARATARAREMAIRLALGSTRGQLVRRFLTESLVLALAGGAASLLVARWGRHLLETIQPPNGLPSAQDLTLDVRVLTFTFLVTLVAGLVFGVVPALKGSRADVVSELKDLPARAGGRRFSVGQLLVVGQVALSLVALVATGLLIRSLDATRNIEPRFDAENLAMVSFDMTPAGYDRARGEIFLRQLLERASRIAGAESVTIAEGLPFSGGGFGRTVFLEGQQEGSTEGGRGTFCNAIFPGYFATLGIPLLQGRAFDQGDLEGSRLVVIVNQTMAELFWPDQDPVGQRLRFHGDDEDRFVVGLVSDHKQFNLLEQPRAMAYYPFPQNYVTSVHLVARASANPSTLLPALRQALNEEGPELPWRNLRTLSQAIDLTLFYARTVTRLVGIFGAVALVLSLVGLFGVISYSVAERQREIGIRMALGASRRGVVARILGRGLTLVSIGLGIGLLVSWAGGRLVEGFLFGVEPTDPVTMATASLLLALVAVLAVLVPARRAASVDPVVALRYE